MYRLLFTSEPPQHGGSRGVQEMVAGEVACQHVELHQGHLWTDRFCERDGAVHHYHGGRHDVVQVVVEGHNLGPVSIFEQRCVTVEGPGWPLRMHCRTNSW